MTWPTTTYPILSLHALLSVHATLTPDAVAIEALGRVPLTYGHLLRQVEDVVGALNAMGFGLDSRIAIVLPNGPEMAVAFLAVAACAIGVPLNPTYRGSEFERALVALRASAVIVQAGIDSPVVAAAHRLNVPVIVLVPRLTSPAGTFILTGLPLLSSMKGRVGSNQDVALLLTTSGTTSRPKTVPLTHANVCLGAYNVGRALHLSAADRCLNFMPLFHIHGLIGAVLSSITTGGALLCTSGFHAPSFLAWIDEHRPTWYTAVPTIHRAILSRALASRETFAHSSLRLVRSCSAPLPTRVHGELEDVLMVPVIEAYGMTEAAHQITSNSAPPGPRRLGSVGLPIGVEVAIVDAAGDHVSRGESGEIVIRGLSVTRGYENDVEADRAAHFGEWFRTGDLGYLDDGGYLFLSGRLKEMINRAGTKIAPAEVDEVLLAHPAVGQAVTFAIPHPNLEEEVGAAIVLRPGVFATERGLREFASRHLADFKVPSRVLILDELPTGPTGKLQRIGLAERMGLVTSDVRAALQADVVGSRTPLEKQLTQIWEQVLRCPRVGVHTDFFLAGGDSILGAELFVRVCEEMQVGLSLIEFFETATIAGQARAIARSQPRLMSHCSVAVQSNGRRLPFFCITAGTDIAYLRNLGILLAPDQPLYALYPRVPGTDELRYEPERAAGEYVAEIRAIQPDGPYLVGGWCAGSAVALEVGRLLMAQGEQVAFLALFLPRLQGGFHTLDSYWRSLSSLPLRAKIQRLWLTTRGMGRTVRARVVGRLTTRTSSVRHSASRPGAEVSARIQEINRRALTDSLRKGYPGRLTLFLTTDTLSTGQRSIETTAVWQSVARSGLDIYLVAGDHSSAVRPPHVIDLVNKLRDGLDKVLANN